MMPKMAQIRIFLNPAYPEEVSLKGLPPIDLLDKYIREGKTVSLVFSLDDLMGLPSAAIDVYRGLILASFTGECLYQQLQRTHQDCDCYATLVNHPRVSQAVEQVVARKAFTVTLLKRLLKEYSVKQLQLALLWLFACGKIHFQMKTIRIPHRGKIRYKRYLCWKKN
jgi:hypothetical protein